MPDITGCDKVCCRRIDVKQIVLHELFSSWASVNPKIINKKKDEFLSVYDQHWTVFQLHGKFEHDSHTRVDWIFKCLNKTC